MTQSYKALNRNMRSLNLSQIITFYGVPEKELEMIAEEHSTIMMGKKDLLEMLKQQLSEPYTYVVIDHNRPIKDRFLDKDFNIINIENVEE
jgi:cellulose biosynthesis protein BcsQ